MGVLTGSIDLNKIDKSKIVEGKNGAKYVNIAIVETPNSQYNTHLIAMGTTKEEREKGVKGEVIGGIKKWDDKPADGAKKEAKKDSKDDLPF